MKVKASHIEQLLNSLSQKTGCSQDYPGFAEMSETIGNGIAQRYLYENLFRDKEKLKGSKSAEMNLQPKKLNTLSEYLGFRGFQDFCQSLDSPLDEVLASCVGEYYSYVRRNSEQSVILRSPVSIYGDGQKIWLKLLGPVAVFEGEVKLSNGCLFVLMHAANGKMIHHVYKVGAGIRPKVLQGIFSGVSSLFDPIGGRVVLVRHDENEKLTHEAFDLNVLKESSSLEDRRVAEYFEHRSENNLGIRVAGILNLSLDDLGNQR
ncbi:hypothetical protein [Chryseolinea lacunae]|uniref:Uncharacterized protein n=1 Tax=Chryseolinea lacunae TaxID=2801331 RepID=A0ABS1KQD1_9BACT|nr:hypothetical protein [Chryseolinea lacunae]MBL0741452.1 hypothetical protein [Chryseolinea lacunae]